MIVINQVPTKLQCAYCIRNQNRGGECRNPKSPYDESGCLVFKVDKRGCIRRHHLTVSVKLYGEIPTLNTWCKDYQLNGVNTEMRIIKILALKWDSKRGYLDIVCDCEYFINEYHEDYKEPKKKNNLQLIK